MPFERTSPTTKSSAAPRLAWWVPWAAWPPTRDSSSPSTRCSTANTSSLPTSISRPWTDQLRYAPEGTASTPCRNPESSRPGNTDPMAYRSGARQWSRTAFAMAVVFGSLPLASRIFLGGWGFDGAAEIGCLCLIVGVYFHIVSRRFPGVPDPATILERAGQRASAGRGDQALGLLTEGVRLSPQLWQVSTYRGEVYRRGTASARNCGRPSNTAVSCTCGRAARGMRLCRIFRNPSDWPLRSRTSTCCAGTSTACWATNRPRGATTRGRLLWLAQTR